LTKQQAIADPACTSLLNHFAHLEDPRLERTKTTCCSLGHRAIFAVIRWSR